MSVTYEQFLPYVMPLVPNAPEPTVVFHIRNACIDFCKGSLLLEQEMEAVTTTLGEGTYEIPVPDDTKLAHIIDLFYMNRTLFRRTPAEISARTSRDWMNLMGAVQFYTQFTPNEVTLALAPDRTDVNALTGLIAVIPTRASTTVDDTILERYPEEIAHGAVSKIYAIPNQPFSDPKAALMYGRQFSADIANARSKAAAGQNRAPLHVRPTRI